MDKLEKVLLNSYTFEDDRMSLYMNRYVRRNPSQKVYYYRYSSDRDTNNPYWIFSSSDLNAVINKYPTSPFYNGLVKYDRPNKFLQNFK